MIEDLDTEHHKISVDAHKSVKRYREVKSQKRTSMSYRFQ